MIKVGLSVLVCSDLVNRTVVLVKSGNISYYIADSEYVQDSP